jgi:predicted MFS family arabinose efflux permease
MAVHAVERRAGRGAWNALAVALLAQLGVSIVDQGIPTLTGFVKDDLGLTAAAAGLAVSAFGFGKIFGSYAAGVSADRLGEKKVIVAGSFAVSILVACTIVAPLPLLFVLLVLAGVAAASSTPAGGRLVLLSFPPRRRGLALSIRQCAIPLGGLVAAALLPWIAHASSWRWALFVAAGMTALTVVPLALARLERSDPHEETTHLHGSSPARDRNIRLLTAWGCLVVTGQYAILAFLALDLQQNAGLRLATGSLLVALANAVGIAGRVFWGAASDRVLARGRKPILLVLNATAFASALVLFAVPRSAGIGVFALVAAFAGFALIGYQGLFITMVAESAGPARVGAATGFAVTFVQLAIALTAPLYGLVADAAGTYRAIWGVLAVVLLVAFLPAALVRER